MLNEDVAKKVAVRICEAIEKAYRSPPNFIEVQALVKRFMKYNPDADPEDIDWVSVWEDGLEFSEYVEKLKKRYPMYKWGEAEDYTEERYFNELYSYLLTQARELPEEFRKRLLRELEAEFGFEEPEEAKPIEITPQVEKAIVNLEFLAKYPFIDEARRFISVFSPEKVDAEVFETALKHILDALKHGETRRISGNPVYEILSKPTVIAILTYYNHDWLKRRFALAEALRVEKQLHVDRDIVFHLLLRKLPLNIQPIEYDYEKAYGSYKMPFIDYLKTAKPLLPEPRWKLVNRVLDRGWTYLNKAEAVRLIRAYYQQKLLNMLYTHSPRDVPPVIREFAEKHRGEVADELKKIYNVYEKAKTLKGLPPCIKLVMAKLESREEVTHIENFTLASYLLNIGKSIDEVLELFKNRSDYDEKIARYQIEHIAGLRGSRTRYKPPSCEKLRLLGVCIEGGRQCPRWIKNPIQYQEDGRSEDR